MSFSIPNLRNFSLILITLLLVTAMGCKKSDPTPDVEWTSKSTTVFPGEPIILLGKASDESQILYVDGLVENQAGDTVIKLFFSYPFEAEYQVDVTHYFDASALPKGNYNMRVRVIGTNGEFTETYPLQYKEHPNATEKLTAYVTETNYKTYIDAYDLNGKNLPTMTIDDDLLSAGFVKSKLFVCSDIANPTLYMVDLKTQTKKAVWSSNATFHFPRIYNMPDRVYLSEQSEYIYGFGESGDREFFAQLNGADAIRNLYQVGDVVYIYYSLAGYNWMAAYQASSSQLIRNVRMDNYCHYMFGAGNDEKLMYFYFNDYYSYSSTTGIFELQGILGNESYDELRAYQYGGRCFIGMASGSVYAFSNGQGFTNWYTTPDSFAPTVGIRVNSKSGFATLIYVDKVVTMNMESKAVYLTRTDLPDGISRVFPIELE